MIRTKNRAMLLEVIPQQSLQNAPLQKGSTLLYIVGTGIEAEFEDDEDSWKAAVNDLKKKGYNVEVLEFSKEENLGLTESAVREQVRSKAKEIYDNGNALTVIIDAHGNGVGVQDHKTQLDGRQISTYLLIDDVTASFATNAQIIMGECNGGELVSDFDKIQNKNFNLGILSGANTNTKAENLYELLRAVPSAETGFTPDVSGITSVYYNQIKVGAKAAGFLYSPENGLYDMEQGLREIINLKEKNPQNFSKKLRVAKDALEKISPGLADEADKLFGKAENIYAVANKDFNKMLYLAGIVNNFESNTTSAEIESDRALYNALTDEALSDGDRNKKIKEAIKNGAEVNRLVSNHIWYDRLTSTNMYFAVYYGDLETVKTFVKKGAILENAGDAEPDGPNHSASLQDNLAVLAADNAKYDVMFYLLEQRPEFAKTNEDLGTNVVISVLTNKNPDIGVATELLRKYPDIDVLRDTVFGKVNILSLAISSGDPEFIGIVDKRLSEQHNGLTIKKIIEQQNEFEKAASAKYNSIDADIKTEFDSALSKAKKEGGGLNGYEIAQEVTLNAYKDAKKYYYDYKDGRRDEADKDLVTKSSGDLKGLKFLKSRGAILDKSNYDEHLLITSLSLDSFGENPRGDKRFEAFDFLLENCSEIKGQRLIDVRDKLLSDYLGTYPKNVSVDAIVHFFEKTTCPVDPKVFEKIQEDIARKEAQLNEGRLGSYNEERWREEISELNKLQTNLRRFSEQSGVFDPGFDLEAIKKGDYSTLKDSGNNDLELINLTSFMSRDGFSTEELSIIKGISKIFKDVKVELNEVSNEGVTKYKIDINSKHIGADGKATNQSYHISGGREK